MPDTTMKGYRSLHSEKSGSVPFGNRMIVVLVWFLSYIIDLRLNYESVEEFGKLYSIQALGSSSALVSSAVVLTIFWLVYLDGWSLKSM